MRNNWICALCTLVLVVHGTAQHGGSTEAKESAQKLAAVSPPWSTYSVRVAQGSTAQQAQQAAAQQQQAPTGLKQLVQLSLSSDTQPQLGPSFKNLTVQIIPETESRLHVKIHPASEKRMEVPQSELPRPGARDGLRTSRLMYQVLQPVLKANRPFALTVARKTVPEPVFDTRGHMLILKGNYMELTTTVPRGAVLYRIEQQQQQEPAGPGLLQLLSSSNGYKLTPWERNSNSSLAATVTSPYPFYLQVNPDGQAHGVFLLSNNVTDVILKQNQVTYKLSDGILDFYFFMGPSPEAVLRQYSKVVGSTMQAAQTKQQQQQSIGSTTMAPAAAALNMTGAPDAITTSASTITTAAATPTSAFSANTTTSTNSSLAVTVEGLVPTTNTTSTTSPAFASPPGRSNMAHANATAADSLSEITNIPSLSPAADRSSTSFNDAPAAATAAPLISAAQIMRQQLQRYLDSSVFLASSSSAGVLEVPLMVTDPEDARARLATTQFMFGDGLLISPATATAKGKTLITTASSSSSSSKTLNTTGSSSSRNAAADYEVPAASIPARSYFTAGNWYSLYDFRRLKITQGKAVRQQTPAADAAVHMRGGAIIPLLDLARPLNTSTAAAAEDGIAKQQLEALTLVVALPLEPTNKHTILGQTTAGPIPPYMLDRPCAMAHWNHPGRLVSCGFLYGNNSSTSEANKTLQVWYTSVTTEEGRSGSISNLVLMKSQDAPKQLRIEAIKILGVPGTAADEPIISVYKGGNAVEAEYDAGTEVLGITGIQLDANAALNIDWRLRKQ